MRMGILGGTFDPVHERACSVRLGLAGFWAIDREVPHLAAVGQDDRVAVRDVRDRSLPGVFRLLAGRLRRGRRGSFRPVRSILLHTLCFGTSLVLFLAYVVGIQPRPDTP